MGVLGLTTKATAGAGAAVGVMLNAGKVWVETSAGRGVDSRTVWVAGSTVGIKFVAAISLTGAGGAGYTNGTIRNKATLVNPCANVTPSNEPVFKTIMAKNMATAKTKIISNNER